MTVDAIQAELAVLNGKDRRRILHFLLSLEDESSAGPSVDLDQNRLVESIRDFQEGRTVSAEEVHRELWSRIPAE